MAEENKVKQEHILEGEENQDDDSNNELYDLLDAANICGETAVSSIGFSKFLHQGEAEAEYRNASMMLGDAQSHLFQDVYRSVSAFDFASQHQTAEAGELGLDRPFELKSSSRKDTHEEPAPRIFSRLRLAHTHMYVRTSLPELKTLVNSELCEFGCDLMFADHGCFWRGMYYPEEPCEAVDFRVYVNSCPQLSKDSYVLEVVRRSGDSMAFHAMFNHLRDAAMLGGKLTLDNGNVVSSLDDLPLPFPNLTRGTSRASAQGLRSLDISWDDDDEEEDQVAQDLLRGTQDEELFRPLISMSESDFEDVHVQGLALVSFEARKEDYAQRMVAAFPQLPKLLVSRLRNSSHPEVRRHCCTALSSMSAVAALHRELLLAGACEALASVAASTYSKATAETQRQAANALAHFCKVDDTKLAVLGAVHDKTHVFDSLSRCDDSRLTQAIESVRRALQPC